MSDTDASTAPLIGFIKNYADAHYADGGWDVIAECFDDEDIAEVLDGASSEEEALNKFAPLVGVYADRQAEAAYQRAAAK